ncbi:Gfo/Idh/MocA family protein [Chloroflexota bacterium]
MTIGWGILGTGTHAGSTTAPSINGAANSKIVAVCDLSMERAGEFAAKHGVEHVYDSLDKMLENPALDVLYIATPNYLHARQAVQAAEAGKHILCEKPMTITVEDAELMVAACDKNKVKLGVSFPARYHPAHIEARHYIQSGIVGEINVVKAQYCRGGSRGSWSTWSPWRSDPSMGGAGALYGQGVHPIDLLRFMLDSEIEEVRALTDENPPEYPVDDMAYVIIRFENGVTGVVICGMLAPRSENDAVLYGSKAKITCKGTIGAPMPGAVGEFLVDGDAINVRMDFPNTGKPPRMVHEIDDFNNWVDGGIEPDITGRNGLQMVKIGNAILESSREGKAVKITK